VLGFLAQLSTLDLDRKQRASRFSSGYKVGGIKKYPDGGGKDCWY
jgi:hypothetical protein